MCRYCESHGGALHDTDIAAEMVPWGCARRAKWSQSRGLGMCPLRLLQVWNSCDISCVTLNTCANSAHVHPCYVRLFSYKIPTNTWKQFDVLCILCLLYPAPPHRIWFAYFKRTSNISLRFSFLVSPSSLPCFLEERRRGGLSSDWENLQSKITKEKRITVLDTVKMTSSFLLAEMWPLVFAVTGRIK